MSKSRRILHVDMDAFFAAVELKRHPDLRGKPMVVGGRDDPHSRGVVSNATYEARTFGIHSGIALRLAWRLCPGAGFLPVELRHLGQGVGTLQGHPASVHVASAPGR